jgi:hypothetical protein
MDSDIEFLEHIFDRMKEAGLVETKAEFSQTLLGKGPSYLTSMAARERIVPMEVLDHMSLRMLDRADGARATIKEREAELCRALADVHREAEIRDEFEAHRRRRLSAELGSFDIADAEPAPRTSRFVAMMLRKVGLVKGVTSATAHGRTLH